MITGTTFFSLFHNTKQWNTLLNLTVVSVEPFPQQGQAEGGIMRLGIINSLQPQGLSPCTFVSVSITSSHDYFLLFEQTTQDSLRNAECRRCFSLACFWQFVIRFWGGYVFYWEKMTFFFPSKISVFMQHQSQITGWKQTGYHDRITVALFVFPMCCMKRHQMRIWYNIPKLFKQYDNAKNDSVQSVLILMSGW